MNAVSLQPTPALCPCEPEALSLPGMNIEDLRVLHEGSKRAIFYRGFCLGTYAEDDHFSRNFFFVHLYCSGGLKIRDLAPKFGFGEQHGSNLVVRFKEKGFEGLQEKLGRHLGPRRIITEKMGAWILSLRAEGKDYREISQAIRFRFKKKIKPESICSWVYRQKKAQGEEVIDSEAGVLEGFSGCLGSDPVAASPLAVVQEKSRCSNVYAGSFLLYAMLLWSDFLVPFERDVCLEEAKPSDRWGIRRILLTLFFLHALRFKSVEQGKHLVAGDFAALVGGDFLRGQWLRYGVDALVSAKGFEKALRAHQAQLLSLTNREDSVYYTDGHFSTYYGKQKVVKGYDPRRQQAYRGRNTIFLHNSQGENVYFFESPTNTVLAQDIETLVHEVKALDHDLGGQTLIFDRGGYSKRCFGFLKKEGLYFVTYLKHRKKEKEVSKDCFELCCVKTEEGQEVEYRIYEKPKRWMRFGEVRILILLGENGRQIPVVTNHPDWSKERVVYLLQRRWREENCFKYMIEHFGLDLLTTYQSETAPDKVIERPHRERQEVNRLLKQKKRELEQYQKALAEKLEDRGQESEEKIKEFYTQEKALHFSIQNAQVDLEGLRRKRAQLPTKEKHNLKDHYVIMAQKRRLLMNVIKAMNYNCEKWLQERIKKYHAKKDETLSLLRRLWQQPGEIQWGAQKVMVRLEPLAQRRMRRSVDQLLENLKENNLLRLPDGRILEITQGG